MKSLEEQVSTQKVFSFLCAVAAVAFGAVAVIAYVEFRNTRNELDGADRVNDALVAAGTGYKQEWDNAEAEKKEMKQHLDQANQYILQTVKSSTIRNKLLIDSNFIPSIPEPEAVIAPPTMQRKANRVDEMQNGDILILRGYLIDMSKDRKLYVAKNKDGIHADNWKATDNNIYSEVAIYKNIEGYHLCVPLKEHDGEMSLEVTERTDWGDYYPLVSVTQRDLTVEQMLTLSATDVLKLKLRADIIKILRNMDDQRLGVIAHFLSKYQYGNASDTDFTILIQHQGIGNDSKNN